MTVAVTFKNVPPSHEKLLANAVENWMRTDFNFLGGHPSLTIEAVKIGTYRAAASNSSVGIQLQNAFSSADHVRLSDDSCRTGTNTRPGIFDGGTQVEDLDGKHQTTYYFYIHEPLQGSEGYAARYHID